MYRLTTYTIALHFIFGCSTTPPSDTAVSSVCNTVLKAGNSNCDLSLQGRVTTIAGGSSGTTASGDTDSAGNSGRFNFPYGVTTDGSYLYIADMGNNKIRRVTISDGSITTLAGPSQGATTSGDADGAGNVARFNNPGGITTDGTNLYVADSGNHKIRKLVIATGVVSTIAGPAPGATAFGDIDDIGHAARFRSPIGITTDGTNLYVADQTNNKIRKIVIASGVVTTFAGPAQGTTTGGDNDGVGNLARFSGPTTIVTDGNTLYVSDTNNHKIRKILIATATVSTVAGAPAGTSTAGDQDGIGTAIRLNGPRGLALDATHLYIADTGNNKLRKMGLTSLNSSIVAGPAAGTTTSGDTDGTGATGRFNYPAGLTTDGRAIYVIDHVTHKLRKLD